METDSNQGKSGNSTNQAFKGAKVLIIDDYANDPNSFVSYSSANDVTSSDDQGTLGDVTVDPQVIGHRHESDVACLLDDDDDQITAAQYSASNDPDYVDLSVYEDSDDHLLDIRDKRTLANLNDNQPHHPANRQRYDSFASHASEDEIAAAQYRAAADPDYVEFSDYDEYIDDQFVNQRSAESVPSRSSVDPAGVQAKLERDVDFAYAGSDFQNLGDDNQPDVLEGGRAH